MSMWARTQPRQQRHALIDGLPLVPPRSGGGVNAASVTNDTANRNSAVWACRRLRADLMSTFPVDVFRKVGEGKGALNVEVPKPPILVDPGGKYWDYVDWMWASQFDYDGAGNTIGLITEVNALGLPARIDLQPLALCSVFQRRDMPEHRYRIDGKEYEPSKVWHERQYPVPGLPVGLSPIGLAAWSISEALTMQQFALDWYGGSAVPRARLHNTKKPLDSDPKSTEARRIKDRYNATMASGDVFVHGNDWELDFMQAEAIGLEWIEGRKFSLAEICRFFGCPADLIEAAIASGAGNITYANITQRNLQFLIINLNPAVIKREKNLSKLLPRPRFVKLNTDALLRMDPETRDKMIDQRLKNKTLTNTEARALYNLPPLSETDLAEIDKLYGAAPKPAPPQPAVKAADPIVLMFDGQRREPIRVKAVVGPAAPF